VQFTSRHRTWNYQGLKMHPKAESRHSAWNRPDHRHCLLAREEDHSQFRGFSYDLRRHEKKSAWTKERSTLAEAHGIYAKWSVPLLWLVVGSVAGYTAYTSKSPCKQPCYSFQPNTLMTATQTLLNHHNWNQYTVSQLLFPWHRSSLASGSSKIKPRLVL